MPSSPGNAFKPTAAAFLYGRENVYHHGNEKTHTSAEFRLLLWLLILLTQEDI